MRPQSRKQSKILMDLGQREPQGLFFEITLLEFSKFYIKKGTVAIDVGANVGFHSLEFLKYLNNSGKVIAIEPIEHLAQNLRGIQNSNFEVHCCAIGRRKGIQTFHEIVELNGWSGLRKRGDTPEGLGSKMYDVQVETLDSLVMQDNHRVSFIKLDLEGGEFDALLGARNLLARDKPVIVFENALDESAALYDYTSIEFFDFFTKIGYQIYDLFGRKVSNFDFKENQPQPWEFILLPKGSSRLLFLIKLRIALFKAKRSFLERYPL